MPRYEYYCPSNGKSMTVHHCGAFSLANWGELCSVTSTDLGSTSEDAALELRATMPCQPGDCSKCHHGDEDHDHSDHHEATKEPKQVHS